MPFRTSISNSSFYSNKKKISNNSLDGSTGIVVYVHLDDSEATGITLIDDLVDKVSDKEMVIGHCKIASRTDSTHDLENIPEYPPANPDEGIPLIGEVVQLVKIGSTLFYKRIPSIDINTGNSEENALLEGTPKEEKPGNQASSYSESSQTGIANNTTNTDNSVRETKFGEYFEPTQINPLRLYEGDKLIQSRFGQSIRFSGYNNEDNLFAPTIIIRNRQSDKSIEDLKEFEPTEEDIINDGSSIVLASGEYEIPFAPGNEEVTLETDDNVVYYEPPELKGTDQILMNSGRIVLSAKDSEMIFFSKGNYSFISDGKLTIDNGLDGAQMDFNGEVRMTTNDNPIYLLGQGEEGKIYLNIENENEPVVRGQTLVKLLGELIDAINQQIYKTPSGPTAVGPTNSGTFKNIKSELETILSTTNFTE